MYYTKILTTKKETGNNSDFINDEVVAIIDKLLEHKCKSKKQPKQILIKYHLLHTKKRKNR